MISIVKVPCMRTTTSAILVMTALIAGSCTNSDDDASSTTELVQPPDTTVSIAERQPEPEPESDSEPESEPEPEWVYDATIRRTSHNIPHITADDYLSLGYGYGYAIAEDHFCTVADLAVQVRGEAAEYFGPGDGDKWINQDLVYRALDLHGSAATELAGFQPDLKDLMNGYAAGVNRYLDETGAEGITGYCSGADWIAPITAEDVAAFSKRLSWQSSITPLVNFIAGATPPTSPTVNEDTEASSASGFRTIAPRPTDNGSNAWAVGPDLTEDATTMLLGNPHFPWQGSLRFYEAHLTIPGALNVYGMSLIGSPVINIGFNDDVAWSHTVSDGRRFTVYSLELTPGDPTTYRYDDETRTMTPATVSAEVLGDDGTLTTVERTLYSSHYGPMLNFPGVGWTENAVLTMRDANRDNDEISAQFLAMAQSGSMDELIDAHREWQGVPWVNTIAASSDGRIWYADTASTPNLSPEAIAAWQSNLETDPLTDIAFQNGTYLLDGGDPLFEWVDSPDARDPGVEPFDLKPQLERSDYVFNANDPYWVAHAEELSSGASPLHGIEQTPVSNRTRMNARQLAPGTNGAGDDGLFTLAELQETALSNRVLTSEMLLDEFLVRCRAESPDQALCDVLDGWDGRVDIDSVGAGLWREFIESFSTAEQMEAGPLWKVPFDPADPIGTPNGLSGDPEMMDRLVGAADNLRAAGFDIDTPLGEMQVADRGGVLVPMHGGHQSEGVTNNITPGSNGTTSEPSIPMGTVVEGSDSLRDIGYPVAGGTSFIYTVEFTAEGPVAAGFLTYGETGDPTSPYFSDQTQRFAAKDWRPFSFTEAAIAGDPELNEYRLTE